MLAPVRHATVLMVVDVCRDAAAQRRPAPSNDAIAAVVGVARCTVIRALAQAEALDLLRVARFQCSRIIAAGDESWVTPAPPRAVGAVHHTRRAA